MEGCGGVKQSQRKGTEKWIDCLGKIGGEMFEGLVSAFSPLEGDALFARTAKKKATCFTAPVQSAY